MRGSLTRRGKNSWRVKFDVDKDPVTGRRRTRYVTVRGNKAKAQEEAAKIVAGLATGSYVDSSKETVAEFSERWLKDWAAANTSNKTYSRYAELLRKHVAGRIGGTRIQKLNAGALQGLYGDISRAGLHPRTVLHVHRVVHRMLRHAAQWGVVHTNAAALVDAPSVKPSEIEVLTPDQIKAALASVRTEAIYPIAKTLLATGMRRNEALALRWQDVDLDGAVLRVERSLEQTKRGGVVFKAPKTRYGRRAISLPASAVALLRAHRIEAQRLRLALGGGKLPTDALLFANPDGAPLSPNAVTKAWQRAMGKVGIRATLHSLRHLHASMLIASGLDVLTISRRLGHGSPAITLTVYGHLFRPDDRAAQIIEATLAGTD